MATTPTVLAGASSSSTPVTAPTPNTTRFPVVPLLIAVVLGALVATLGAGGCVYYLARSGRLPGFGSGPHKATESPVPTTTHVMVLEPLLVNLADAGGSSYLRVAIALRVVDTVDKKSSVPKDEKGMNEAVASVRDTLLEALGRQSSDDLLATEGKEHLKAALKEALAEHNSNLKVTDVFFTDFLVQR